MIEKPYKLGKQAALNYLTLPKSVISKLRSDADYWQGFHDWRPKIETTNSVVEDPTRGGGWCFLDKIVKIPLKLNYLEFGK